MGSTSSTPAALIRVWSLSDYATVSGAPLSSIPSVAVIIVGFSNFEAATGSLRSTHGNLNAIVGEDQSRVGGGNFGVRHCD